ncbi:MAG: hypothetical protein FJ088_10525, partial [Deltaproteobacteria bacterium]|nr:hypothetical protein [Deltaproteobacteria bacterium]
MGNGENPFDPAVQQQNGNAPQEKGERQKEAQNVQPEPVSPEEEEQLKEADQSNEAVNAQLKDAAVQEKVQKTPLEKQEQGPKEVQTQKGGKNEAKQKAGEQKGEKEKVPGKEQKEEKGETREAPEPAPFTDFDQLTCEEVENATSTTHIPQSNETTQATVVNAEQIAQQETPGWGSVALAAVRDATIGPFTGGWWGKRFDAFGEIWGQKSPYGDSWIGQTLKVLHTVRTVTDTIGSIAGTIGLWTSLLSLVGLIPGLQPIGAALATVAQICTLVSFICSA